MGARCRRFESCHPDHAKRTVPCGRFSLCFSAAGLGLWHLANKARCLLWGSEGSAAGGGRSDPSEWQRSADAKERRRRRQMPGTATGTNPKMPQVRILSSGPFSYKLPLRQFVAESVYIAGFEPIAVELSGGQFLPPVQTLVASSIFAKRKCISNPVIRTK